MKTMFHPPLPIEKMKDILQHLSSATLLATKIPNRSHPQAGRYEVVWFCLRAKYVEIAIFYLQLTLRFSRLPRALYFKEFLLKKIKWKFSIMKCPKISFIKIFLWGCIYGVKSKIGLFNLIKSQSSAVLPLGWQLLIAWYKGRLNLSAVI